MDDLILYNRGRSPLLGLEEQPVVGTGVDLSRILRSRDLMERSETVRALSANLRDVGVMWLQTRKPGERNVDALLETGSVRTGTLFRTGERSFARLRISVW